MNLESLSGHLVAKGVGVEGKDLFIHRMPSSASEGILLMNKLSGTPIDYDLPGFKRTGFRVIVRNKSITGAVSKIKQVMSELTLNNEALPDMSIYLVRPKHDPVVYPVSDGDFTEASVNFEAVYLDTTL